MYVSQDSFLGDLASSFEGVLDSVSGFCQYLCMELCLVGDAALKEEIQR